MCAHFCRQTVNATEQLRKTLLLLLSVSFQVTKATPIHSCDLLSLLGPLLSLLSPLCSLLGPLCSLLGPLLSLLSPLLSLLSLVFGLLGKLQRCWHHGSLYGEPPEPALSDTQIQTRRRRIDLLLGIWLDLVIAQAM